MKLKDFIQNHKAEFDNERMSKKADFEFEKLLQQELHQPKKQKVVYFKFVAVAACIVFVFTTVLWLQNKESFTKVEQELMANLEDNSAGKRLEAVYTFNDDYKKEDARIINRLIQIIHKDENTNVKIATIDALLQFPKKEKIRKNLIKALEEEQAPLVQIKLIKALSILRENRAQKPLEDLINNKQTFPIVKNNATLAINEIKK